MSRFKICTYELGDGSLTQEQQYRIRQTLKAERRRLMETPVAVPDAGRILEEQQRLAVRGDPSHKPLNPRVYLAHGAADKASQPGSVEGSCEPLAAVPEMRRHRSCRQAPQMPPLLPADIKPITQADIDRAVAERRRKQPPTKEPPEAGAVDFPAMPTVGGLQ